MTTFPNRNECVLATGEGRISIHPVSVADEPGVIEVVYPPK
jgi:hypothetical protein